MSQERTQKIRNPCKNNFLGVMIRCNETEKSNPLESTSLGPIINLHIKFLLPSSTYRRVTRVTNSKKLEISTKKLRFFDCERM